MAVTKIWDIKGRLDHSINYVQNEEKITNPKYEEAQLQALTDVIDYAMNEDKTEKHYYVTGINCNTTCARRQFITIKESFGKEDGIMAFHGYQSFAPGETTPAQAHEIGVKLAKTLWGDRFQVLVATHLNTECIHNHFLLNSVSFRDGKKYHDCRASYWQMKTESDRLCREYGLSVIENPVKGKSEPIYSALDSKTGMPTRYNVARAAIDEAISKSCNMKEFEMHLRNMGYTTQFNPRRKYWTVVPKGWNKPIRLARLGEEYTNERIMERVLVNPTSVRIYDFQKAQPRKAYLLLTRKDKINKVRGLRGLYLKYLYRLGYLPKYKQDPKRVHFLLKEDLMKCEMFSKQARLLGKNDIGDISKLQKFIETKEQQLITLVNEREELRKAVRRVMPEEERMIRKEQISEVSKRIKGVREELKLCKDIEERSTDMEEKLNQIEREEKGEKENVFIRCSRANR